MNARNIRRRFWWGIRALVVGIIVFVIVGGWNMVERSWLYPYDYRSRIETSAAHYHVDPYLVAAVIKHESKFRPNAKSTGGALGMMQLMPQTAEWIARQMDEPFTEDYLYDPALNIRYGVWYLAELEQEFGGNDKSAQSPPESAPHFTHVQESVPSKVSQCIPVFLLSFHCCQ